MLCFVTFKGKSLFSILSQIVKRKLEHFARKGLNLTSFSISRCLDSNSMTLISFAMIQSKKWPFGSLSFVFMTKETSVFLEYRQIRLSRLRTFFKTRFEFENFGLSFNFCPRVLFYILYFKSLKPLNFFEIWDEKCLMLKW